MQPAKTQEDIRQSRQPQEAERNRMKVGVVLNEFPFIRKVIRDNVLARISDEEIPLNAVDIFLTQAYVSRLTEEIILKVPHRNAGGLGEVVFFLDEKGEVLEVEMQPEPWRLKLFIFWGPIIKEWQAEPWYYRMVSSNISFRGKCLGDILESFGFTADKVAFALSYDTRTTSVILYRRVKEMRLVDWMTRYEERTLEQLREELRDELKE